MLCIKKKVEISQNVFTIVWGGKVGQRIKEKWLNAISAPLEGETIQIHTTCQNQRRCFQLLQLNTSNKLCQQQLSFGEIDK